MSDRRAIVGMLIVGVASPVLSTAIIGVWSSSSLGLAGQTLQAMSKVQITLSQNQAVMQSQLLDVRTALQGIYTQQDAKRDLSLVWNTDKDQYDKLVDAKNELVDHEQRIRRLEADDRHHKG